MTVATLIDSHVHLDADAFAADRDAVIERAHAAGVTAMIVPGVCAPCWPRIAAVCSTHACVYPTYGLHPLAVDAGWHAQLGKLQTWLADHPAVAIGECGLDFAAPDADRARQRQAFEAQLEIARDHSLPVIVHARRTFEDVLHTLHRFSGLHGVIHSFSGSLEQARRFARLNFVLGIGGPVTYPRAQRLRRTVATVPIEWLVLETDAPDQPGLAQRGQRNEPACLADVLQCVAALRGQDADTVAAITAATTRALFALP